MTPSSFNFRQLSTTGIIYLAGACWVMLYVVASFLPDSPLWGLNQLAFFPGAERIGILLLALILLIPPVSSFYLVAAENLLERVERTQMLRSIVTILLGTASMLIFFRLKIVTDIYGDTRTLLSWLSEYHYSLVDLLDPKATEPLTRMIHQSVADWFHLDLKFTFQVVGVLAGGIAVMTYLLAVQYVRGPAPWKLFVLLVGLTAGVNQLYFGHVEDYTLVHLWSLFFLIVLWISFEGKNVVLLMVASLVVGARLHVEAVFYMPTCIYAILHASKGTSSHVQRWIEPRAVGVFVGITVLAGTLAYFFYFHADHYLVGDRDEVFKKLFLPLANFHLPPHSYSLVSWKHISDWIQEIFFTVSPAAVGMFILALVFRRRIDWKDPKILGYGLASFYFLLFNLTINPMLTPIRDWDFLSLAADPLTFLAIALSQQIFPIFKESGDQRTILATGVALAVISCSIFLVNADPVKVSRRLEGAGTWAYHGFYSGSSYIINVGEKMITDPGEQITRREEEIRKLEPSASHPDLELGVLYHKLGEAALVAHQYDLAMNTFTLAYANDSTNASAIRSLGLIAMLNGRYDDAEEMLDYYNENLNRPIVRDFGALELAQDLAHLRLLEADHADSSAIRHQREDIHAFYVGEYYK